MAWWWSEDEPGKEGRSHAVGDPLNSAEAEELILGFVGIALKVEGFLAKS